MAEQQARNFPKIQVTLSPDVMEIVDARAREIEAKSGRFNRSEAIRELILDSAKPRSKGAGKKSKKT